MAQVHSSKHSLFDAMLEIITGHPINGLLFFLLLCGVFLSLVSVGIGLLLSLFIRWFRIPALWILIFGLVLGVSAWLIDGISVHVLHRLNDGVFIGLLHANLQPLQHIYVWLSAIPYGILFSALFSALLQHKSGLQKDIKRVAQGKHNLKQRFVCQKRLQRAFHCISQSAYDAGTTIGVDRVTGQPVVLTDSAANLHTLVVGTTGSGKTTGLGNIIESAIQRKLPLFYVDGKGDRNLAERVAQYSKQQGRPFYLFSMVGDSVKYNPLASGGFTSKKDRIVELRHWSEDHYRKLAESYLQTVFKVLEHCQVQVDLFSLAHHLEDTTLYQLTHNAKDPSLNDLIKTLKAKRPSIESLIAEIETIAQSEIGDLFDCSSGTVLTLRQALEEKAIVYFCLQPLAFPAYAETLGKLIINDLKALIATQLSQEVPEKIITIFDEFSVFAGTQIMHLINQGRGAGVHAVLSTQSLSDVIEKGSDALLGQILNNTNNYLIQRQNNPDDAETLANIIGTKEDFVITSQVMTQQTSSPTGSIRLTREFIIHPDEIKRLSLGQAIFVNKQPFNVQHIQLRKGVI